MAHVYLQEMCMDIAMRPEILWLALLVIFIITEALTLGLTTIWFAGGSAAALIVSLAGGGFLISVVVFLILSLILLLMVRPLAKSKFNSYREKTNAQALIGKPAVVIESIDNIKAVGRVSVSGQEWAARSADEDGSIEKDEIVTVKDISGVKLIVTRSAAGRQTDTHNGENGSK